MREISSAPSGRKAQAARNDTAILDAAREVFMRDPDAPISAVAQAAGVGISALYRRYAGKEELLQTLCADGLRRYIGVAESALRDGAHPAEPADPWESFAGFIRGIIDADVHALTVHLAGTFTPTQELRGLAEEANRLSARLLRRAKAAGVVRPDLHLNDLAMLWEQLTAVRLGDAGRTAALRHRYLVMHLDALRPGTARTRLPGRPPSSAELGQRWVPRTTVGSRPAAH
jgi:AcrR family transcriptional regulator